MFGSGQHQGIAEHENLPHTIHIDDLDTGQIQPVGLDPDLLWLGNQVIDPFQRDFDEVILRVVSDAEEGQPLRLDLIAEIESGDFDFGALSRKNLGHGVEIRLPDRLLELLGHGCVLQNGWARSDRSPSLRPGI